MTLSRKAMGTSLLAFALVLDFSSLAYWPGVSVLADVWAGLCVCFVVYVLLIKNERVNFFLFYALIAIFYFPLCSAFAAHFVFGQPFEFGVLAQRKYFYIGFVFLFLHLAKLGAINATTVCKAFVALAWFFLIGNSLALQIFDPSQIFVGDDVLAEARQRRLFDTSFIVFGFFYYSISAVYKNVARYYLFAIMFLAYQVLATGGRGALLSMFTSLVLCLFAWRGTFRSMKDFSKLVFIVPLGFVAFSYIDSVKLEELSNKFEEAIYVVSTGKEGNDDSANSRLLQMEIALPYIEKSPLFGSGQLSAQWRDGFSGNVGYFYPSDNGYLGVLFVFGMFGLIFGMIQVFFFWRITRGVSRSTLNDSIFIRSLQSFLVFYFFSSFTTGKLVFSFEQSIFLLSVLQFCVLQILKVSSINPSQNN